MTDAVTGTAREALERLVVDVPDFPEPGVVFKDITPLLADHAGFSAVVERRWPTPAATRRAATVVDKVVGMEARGFILAAPVALALGAGFVPVRKAGKLPRETHAVSYALEYGEATLELHRDARRRRGSGCCSSTTSWPPAAPSPRPASWSSRAAAPSSASPC